MLPAADSLVVELIRTCEHTSQNVFFGCMIPITEFVLFSPRWRHILISVLNKSEVLEPKPPWQILMTAPPLFPFNSCWPHFDFYWPPIRGEDTKFMTWSRSTLGASLFYGREGGARGGSSHTLTLQNLRHWKSEPRASSWSRQPAACFMCTYLVIHKQQRRTQRINHSGLFESFINM